VTANNTLIRSLAEPDYAAIAQLLVPVRLKRDEVLHEPGDEVQFVHFPETCVISLVQSFTGGQNIETATIGCEGCACLSVAFGSEQADARYVVQIGGDALRMARTDFSRAMEAQPAFRSGVQSFMRGFLHTTLLSVACNRMHSVEQRLARWLLMTLDRSREGPLTLTHDTVSDMLGVHRPTVTVALRDLREAGIVETRPGTITILDRARLEDKSCECYRLATRALPAGC